MGWMRKREIRRRILSQIERYANSWFGNGSFGHERQIHHSQAKKGCKIPSRNGVNVSTTTLILATWTTTSNYFLPICVQCAENGERKLFFESDTVLNLWKYIIFYEVSPTKVSSLRFKITYEDLCVNKCVSQEKWNWKISCNKIFHIASQFNIIKINSANRFLMKIKWNCCEITSPNHEQMWSCPIPSLNVSLHPI